MLVLKNGKVLAFTQGYPPPTTCLLFDPVPDPPTFVTFDGPASPDPHDLLCTGHVALADGKIFFTGSAPFAWTTTLYDPDVEPPGPASWIPQDDGSGGDEFTDRFYPTCTLLGDGTVLVTAGRYFANNEINPEADIPAIFDPSQPTGQGLQWRSLISAGYADRTTTCNPAGDLRLDQYPFMFLLSTGDAVYAGTDESANPFWSTRGSWSLNTQSEVWTELVPEVEDTIWGGSAVMYRRDKIMKAGGRGTDCETAIASVFTLDATAANPTWVARPSMNNARTNHVYLIVLPDGKILATNGKDDDEENVLAPELFDPDDPTAVWDEMAPMSRGRAHHAVAILLPDARVLVGGGSSTGEIYSPPYLFQGPRPTIEGGCSEPDTMCYGQTASVMTPDANQVTAVSLIRPGGTTHGFDFDQRFLDLNFTIEGSDELSVTAPATSNEAPPGHYMLYVLTGDVPSRVPSKARFMLLSGGNGADCNTNAVPDDCDIAGGTSADCNCNGIPDDCEGAINACCLPDGSCNETWDTCCTAQGGTAQGPGTTCDATGACCLGDGSCQPTLEVCCTTAGGTFRGLGTDCASTVACCIPGVSCQGTLKVCCVGAGGTVKRPGTTCTDQPGDPFGVCCPQPFGPCIETFESCCDAEGGLFYSGETCPYACPSQQGPQQGG